MCMQNAKSNLITKGGGRAEHVTTVTSKAKRMK
jgi:hypothetical protein